MYLNRIIFTYYNKDGTVVKMVPELLQDFSQDPEKFKEEMKPMIDKHIKESTPGLITECTISLGLHAVKDWS